MAMADSGSLPGFAPEIAMNTGKTLFAQIMEFVQWTSFARIVDRPSGNAGVRTLSCAEQYRAMALRS